MNWFEEWFDSPYYHILYANRSEEEAANFIERISKHLSIHSKAKVIDVACGKGRHSRTLAKLGFDVTGIDLSKNSIHFAKQFESEHLHFDMRTVYRKNEFDFVFNLFSSFGYFDDVTDDYRCIQAFLDNLKPEGKLIIDYINSEWAVKNMKSREIIPRGDIQFHIQKKIEGDFIKKKIEFLSEGESHSFQEQLKIINKNRFEFMLTRAGFKVECVFGDYPLNKFDASSSPRLIIVAQKM
jgi:2-polyprenyl-3-methyl-5-hydroxy-6-metoxy-1,4-benzoquinol methylase